MVTRFQRFRRLFHPLRREWRARVVFPAHVLAVRLHLFILDRRGRRLTVTVDGMRLQLTPRGAIAEQLCREGGFEPQEVSLILSLIQPGGTFFDVGANVGLFSLAAAKRFPDAHIYAFEPCAATLEILKRNVALNGASQVTPVPVALMDHSGTASLQTNAPGKDGLNTLGEPTHPACRIVSRETVSVSTLDDFLASERLIGVDVMKVDVEGAELLVLRGGEKLLSGPHAPLILYEGYSQTMRGFGYRPTDIAYFLHGCGYQLFALGSGGLTPVDTEEAAEAMLLAAKPSHLAALPALAQRADGIKAGDWQANGA